MARPVALRRLYPAIGEFIVEYAVVQGLLRTTLIALHGVRGKGAATLVYGMSDEVVTRKLRLALQDYGKQFHKFHPALARLQEVAVFRNQIVHWVPFISPTRTTLEGFVDANRDYKNRNQPQVNCTPRHLRNLTRWLTLFEWDLITVLMTIDNKLRFNPDDYRTLQDGFAPDVPKSKYSREQ